MNLQLDSDLEDSSRYEILSEEYSNHLSSLEKKKQCFSFEKYCENELTEVEETSSSQAFDLLLTLFLMKFPTRIVDAHVKGEYYRTYIFFAFTIVQILAMIFAFRLKVKYLFESF